MEHDSLRTVRSCFYTGLYQQCIDECQEVGSDQNVNAAVYAKRALAMIDPVKCIQSINQSAPTSHQAIKEFARYQLSKDEHERSNILDSLMDWKSNEMTGNDRTLTVICASLLIGESRFKDALPMIIGDAESLEKLSLCVIAYLSIDRPDLAQKSLKAMTDLDDDDVLTQLASAWCLLNNNSDYSSHQSKVLEAESILQGLSETFPTSPRLLAMLAVCELHKHNYTDAFRLLRQAKDLGKEGAVIDEELLLNSIVSVQHTGSAKSEELIAAIRSELKPDGAWATVQSKRIEEFERQAANYKWTQ